MTSMEKMHLKREWEEAAAVISIARSTYLSNFFRVLAPLGVIKIHYPVFSINKKRLECLYMGLFLTQEVAQEYADKSVVMMWCIL